MKNQITNQRNQANLSVKVLLGLTAMMSILTLCGCQESSTLTRTQTTSSSSDKTLTLAVFPEKETVNLTERKDLYLVGTQSYADKLMKIYEGSDIPTLPTQSNSLGHDDHSCVPILMLTF